MAGKKSLPRYNSDSLLLYSIPFDEDVDPEKLEEYRTLRTEVAEPWYILETRVLINMFDKDGIDYAVVPAKRENSRRYRMLVQKALHFRDVLVRYL